MNEIEKTYFKVLNPNYGINTPNEKYSFKDFLKISFNNIIYEEKKHPGIKNLCSKILNSKFNEKISFDELSFYFKDELNTIDKRPLVILKMNFSKPEHLNFILNEYGLTFGNDNIKSVKEKYHKDIESFKKELNDADGALTKSKNAYLLFLNEESANEITVKHELEHYLQYVKNESLSHGVSVEFGAKSFKMSLNDINYYLSNEEFIPNIKINFVNDLKKLYILKYKNLSKEDFLNEYLRECENDPLNILDSNIGCNFRNVINKHKLFCVLPLCKVMMMDDLYNLGKETLKKYF